MKKLTFITLIVFYSVIQTNSQTFTNYTVENTSTTLNGWEIMCMAIDSQGNKWFGTTYGGVSKFDGTNWTTYTTADGLVDNEVASIAIDSEGNKWFGTCMDGNGITGGGVSKFDGTTWTTYTTADGLVSNNVKAIIIDFDGNVWVGASSIWVGPHGGVSKFDGTTWTTYTTADGLASNNVKCVAIDLEGNKWFGTSGGVSKFNDTTWTTYTTADGLANNTVYTIAIDSEGNKWFGTWGGGVSKFNDTTWTTYTTADGLAYNYVESIAIDSEGNKWFGTYSGVSMFNDTTWTTFTTDDGLVSNRVLIMNFDNQGNKWFGTSRGVSMFDDTKWTTYKPNGLAYNDVRSILVDSDNNKWFGTLGEGVSKFDEKSWMTYTISDSLAGNKVYCIKEDKYKNKWFGTNGGVSKYDGVTWTNYTTADGLGSNSVYSIAIDNQDNKWFATLGGVTMFDGKSWKTYTENDGLTNSFPLCITIDEYGNIWTGHYSNIEQLIIGGISKFDGNKWTSYSSWDFGTVWSVIIDIEGNKWIGAEGALIIFDDLSWGKNYIDSLITWRVNTVTIDNNNIIWAGSSEIATYGGISKYDGTTWTTYTRDDGLPSFWINTIFIDEEGNKWFGTGHGVSKFTDGGAGPLVLSSKKIQKGVVFEDLNGNGIKDSTEQGLAGHKIKTDSILFSSTNGNGMFYVFLNNGQHSLQYIKQGYWQTTTDTLFTFNVTDTTVLDTIYIGVKPDISINDVSVYITGSPTRANFTSQYWINYKNLGSVTQQGVVEMQYDTLITFVNAAPSPALHTGNVLTWNFDTLASLECRQIFLQFKMPGVESLNDTLSNVVYIAITGIDIVPSNNSCVLLQRITGSYDPNDKLVAQGVGTENYVLHNSVLEYTIRFQNTGTDTAFNVNIRDSIDLNLNIETLEILASSHPVQLELRGKNEAIFKFQNILLPDSNVNEPGSHGFVKYSIKPKKQLTDNTVTTNKAYIYFDFNPAIITNEVKNTYVSVIPKITSFQKIKESEKAISIYPNPSSGVFKINIETGQALSQPLTIQLYDLMGKQVYSRQVTSIHSASGGTLGNHSSLRNHTETIDISGYNKGIYVLRVQTDRAIETRRVVVR